MARTHHQHRLRRHGTTVRPTYANHERPLLETTHYSDASYMPVGLPMDKMVVILAPGHKLSILTPKPPTEPGRRSR
jgi:hypothetical protein